MRGQRWFAGALVGLSLFALAAPAPAAPAGKPGKPEVRAAAVSRQGEAFCFDRALVFGSVVIPGGRCYTFYLVRTSGGSHLGFGPPGPPMIPPGQLVRLRTPAGAKLKGRLFYLIPLPVAVTIIPVDAIRFVQARVVPEPGRVVIRIPGIATSGGQEKEIELPFLQR